MRKLLLASALAFGAPLAAFAADHTVFFALNSASITADGRAAIEAAAADFVAKGSSSVSIVGHTDTSGPSDFNMRLSQRRAEAVGQALIAAGVPADALVAAWRGESEPAVATADGVVEARNRRVEISVAAPDAPAAAPVAAVEEALKNIRIGLGPYVGFSFEEDDESVYLGGNLFASYFVTPNIALSAEQAVFYNTDAKDEGWGGRSLLGADYHFTDLGWGATPYIGANAGYMYIDGTGTGGFFGGPEIGLTFGNGIEAKVAYDFVEDRDAEEGVISLTLGYNFLSF
jgi:hypothetical protein